MPTAIDLINRAYTLLGVKADGETLTAELTGNGLNALNSLIDSWRTEEFFIYSIVEQVFSMQPNQQIVTIGEGGDINVAAPISLEPGIFVRTSDIDYQVEIATRQQYEQIIQKSSGASYPNLVYYERILPIGNLYFYPLPGGTYELHLPLQVPLTEFTDLTTDYLFPPGYRRALEYSLAEELAPGKRKLDPAIARAAQFARRSLKRSNRITPILNTGSRAKSIGSGSLLVGASSVTGDYIPLAQKGAPGGVATLDDDGIVPVEQLPPFALIDDDAASLDEVYSSQKVVDLIAAIPTVAPVTSTTNGLMIAVDKVKLDTVATGATANATDAFLRALGNATGSLPQVQIVNLLSDLAARLLLTGGTMTGFLTLNADPTAALHAATRQWVLAQIPGASARTILTTTTTLVAGTSYGLNTSAGAFTVTLPASPAAGARIPLLDARGTWGTNNATVARNGQPINGSATDLVLDRSYASLTLEYIDATYGWAVA